MFKFIENLQNKPKHVRIFILWVSVAVSAVFILGFWLFSLDLRIQNHSQTEVAENKNQLQEIKKNIPTLWQTLKAGISGIFEDATEEEKKDIQIETEDSSVEFEKNDLQNPYFYMLP
ncbi:MAG: hypothetical protein PHQ47_00955 [Candidatus Portnoybacteria bacterium]|nr:hypothetical protein [Candidatus Portnoybacteria bacterium]